MNLKHIPGGREFWIRVALARSLTTKVYKYLLHRSLNFTWWASFLIATAEIGLNNQ